MHYLFLDEGLLIIIINNWQVLIFIFLILQSNLKGAVAKVLEFEFQLSYYIQFWSNTQMKGMNSLIQLPTTLL